VDNSGRDNQASASQTEVTATSVVEALLFCADGPLPGAKISQIVGAGGAKDVRQHVEALNQRYEQMGSTFRIEQIGGGYQMLTLPQYSQWVEKLKRTRAESKLSQAALETLAIVAYIEAVRGVAVGEVVNRLREMGLVKIAGRAEDIGRPMLYGTTKKFLEVFGLNDLGDLPQVGQLKAPPPV